MKQIHGGLLYLAYKLEYYDLFQLPLKNCLWLALVALVLLAVFGRLSWFSAALIGLLPLLLILGVAWAKRGGYVLFEPDSFEMDISTDPPLGTDDQIPCRASGSFAVEGKTRHLVDEKAWFSFVSTREHILMAQVQARRFLLLATIPEQSVGWWYVFFTPDRVHRVRPGTLVTGLRVRPALAIQYQPEGQPGALETVYLAFCDVKGLRDVLADLRVDVPPVAFARNEDT